MKIWHLIHDLVASRCLKTFLRIHKNLEIEKFTFETSVNELTIENVGLNFDIYQNILWCFVV